MVDLDELTSYLDEYLQIGAIEDYGPQGLQIEGRQEVNKIVGMVDSGQPCVNAALDRGADLLLVHHGIFWGPPQRLRGSYGALVRTYVRNDLNLYAAHLALDAHQEVGNNAELARRLGLKVEGWWAETRGVNLAAMASSSSTLKLEELVDRYEEKVGPTQLVLAHGPDQVRKVGIMSGAGARYIEEAAAIGCDAYITGETSHAQYYDALNAGIHVLYGGHYTSETVGVQALGRHLQETFEIDFEFVDLPTGL